LTKQQRSITIPSCISIFDFEKGDSLKRIVLLLDGTWNDSDVGMSDTNIVRLRENIASCLDPAPRGPDTTTPSSVPNQTSVSYRSYKKTVYIVFYERGVGTGGFFDNVKGGAFGVGLSSNIRRAYLFLSRHYEPGDEIFIFGFSRGSYTARSLVGYIGSVGLLRASNCTAANESRAWYHYRTNPLNRLPTEEVEIRRNSYPVGDVRIKFLGVFDTVGALGIPIAWFRRENRDLFEFHDVGLSPKCDVSMQALAIDEHREAFEATLWRQPKFEQISCAAEQVWFAGAHSDIGGGYIDERMRASLPQCPLDDITLDWMIKRLLHHYRDFPVNNIETGSRAFGAAYLAPHHEPRRSIFSARPFAYRSIGNCYGTARRSRWEVDVCYDRHNIPIGEMVHISALFRLGKRVIAQRLHQNYLPRNLIAALSRIEESIGVSNDGLGIAGWDGLRLHPVRARTVIESARNQLKTLNYQFT
jgi:hypothetical protein